MPEPAAQRVNCPHCNKGYRWSDKLAGRLVDCKQCGERFVVPNQPGIGIAPDAEPTQDDTYELALDEDGRTAADPEPKAAPAVGGRCPVCNTKVPETAVICLNCGFNMKEGKRVETAVLQDDSSEAEAQGNTGQAPPPPPPGPMGLREERDAEAALDAERSHQWNDYVLPAILTGIGLVLMLFNNLFFAHQSPSLTTDWFGGTVSWGELTLATMIDTVFATGINTVLLFLGLLLLVALFGASYGALQSVILKILAIVLLCQEVDFTFFVVMDIATGGAGFLAVFINWAIYLTVMIGLCVKLLEMDMTEFRVFIVFIIVGHMASSFLINFLIAAFF
ncbi:MAG: hypothetical protein AAGC44_06530 [Planctomycetota bacterium]